MILTHWLHETQEIGLSVNNSMGVIVRQRMFLKEDIRELVEYFSNNAFQDHPIET